MTINDRTLAVDEFINQNNRVDDRRFGDTDEHPEGHILIDDVKTTDLAKYPLHQLEARLISYEREVVFETNGQKRRELRREVERTRIEINRRKMYARKEAERVFEL